MSRKVTAPYTRPWAVMRSYRSFRTGEWTRWRVWGTYATRDRAVSGALKAKLYGEVKTHVVGPGEPRVGPHP
jgi:hypothetical protein